MSLVSTASPQTIGDLIAEATATDSAQATAADTLKATAAAQKDAHAALGAALAAEAKPVVHDEPDGSATIYTSDGAGGFVPTPAVHDSVPIPAPSPVPVP